MEQEGPWACLEPETKMCGPSRDCMEGWGEERCCGGENLASSQDLVLLGADLTDLGTSFSHLSV